MKFPEQRFSMETALPPSVQNWFGHELEIRGIDSVIYSRHIIQLLQQEDLDDTEFPDYVDLLFDARNEGKGKFKLKKLEKKQNVKNQEERKKNAAIKCLQAVCEEANGIDTLVDELCSRLKDLNTLSPIENDNAVQKESSSSCTESDASSSELDDPAERYYAAFPALHGNDQQSPPVGSESLHVWKNNPITKTNSLEKDSGRPGKASSEYDVNREKKLKKSTQRKRNHSRPCPRKTPEGVGYQRQRVDNTKKEGKGNGEQNEFSRICRFLSWPQGNNNVAEHKTDQDRELCSKVENLLKEMLLHKDETSQDCPIVKPASTNEGSVSPELQENDLWYTQPIEVLFSSDESRQRLYKRNSNPLFTSTCSSPSYNEEEQLILLEDNLANLKVAITSEEEEDDPTAVSKQLSKSSPENLTYAAFTRELGDVKSTSPIPIPKRCEAPVEASGSETILSSLQVQSAFHTSPYDNILDVSSDESQSSGSQASVLNVESLPGQGINEPPDSNLSLLDRNYLISLAEKFEAVECPYLPLQSFTAFGLPGLTEVEESTWPSKVLFADFVLPYDLIWNDVGIEYSTEFSERLKSGNLSQVWDVNYQKIKGSYLPFKDIWAPEDYTDQGWFYPVVAPIEDVLTANLGLDQIWGSDGKHSEVGYEENSLTDIPQIMFDLASEVGSEYDNLLYDAEDILLGMDDLDTEAKENQHMSYGDFNMMWASMEHTPNHLKMSRSFELVPSEGSAFVDAIPRKLHHVHSEPNLRYHSLENQEFRSPDRKTKSDSQTPEEEHLYFSPKTHFRPIQTPTNHDTMTDYHLKDLFGGYPASKTPYQKYVDKDNSDSEEFVPMFKIRKDLDKYIQTSSSLEDPSDSYKENLGRDQSKFTYYETEETRAIITEDFDIVGYVDSLTASAKNTPQNLVDAQYANIDSGYEDTDVDGYVEKSEEREKFKPRYNQSSPMQMVGHNWQEHLKCQESDEAERKPVCSCPTSYSMVDMYNAGYGESYNNVFLSESEPVVHHWMISQAWGLDPGTVGVEEENVVQQNIWSSSDDHMPLSAVFGYTEENENKMYHNKEAEDVTGNPSTENSACTSYGQSYSELSSYFLNNLDSHKSEGSSGGRSTLEGKDGRVPLLDKENHPPTKENGDIVKVKLVIRKGRTRKDFEQENDQSPLFMPMPIAAVYSCELEEAWMTQHFSPEFLQHSYSEHISKGSKRKPCSFFMEGTCRRSDCKYAHDLSGIPCRFWMNGDCFKGDLCPFLHGYPGRKSSPESLEATCEHSFEFQPEDFPVLEEPTKDAKRARIVKVNKPRQSKQPLKSCKVHLNRKSQKSVKDERTKITEKRQGLKRKSSGCGIMKDSAVL